MLGQYDGYRDVAGIAYYSDTDTLDFAARLWASTPIAGAACRSCCGTPASASPTSQQRVTLTLTRPPDGLVDDPPPTAISLSLKGSGELDITVVVKRPGPDIAFSSRAAPLPLMESDVPDLPAYSTLIRDVLVGDRSLFTSSDGLAAAWRVISPLLERRPDVQGYTPGSWGPAAAMALAGLWLAPRRASAGRAVEAEPVLNGIAPWATTAVHQAGLLERGVRGWRAPARAGPRGARRSAARRCARVAEPQEPAGRRRGTPADVEQAQATARRQHPAA